MLKDDRKLFHLFGINWIKIEDVRRKKYITSLPNWNKTFMKKYCSYIKQYNMAKGLWMSPDNIPVYERKIPVILMGVCLRLSLLLYNPNECKYLWSLKDSKVLYICIQKECWWCTMKGDTNDMILSSKKDVLGVHRIA